MNAVSANGIDQSECCYLTGSIRNEDLFICFYTEKCMFSKCWMFRQIEVEFVNLFLDLIASPGQLVYHQICFII